MSRARPLDVVRFLMRRRVLMRTRAWLARSFGVPHETRVAIVVRMLAGHEGSAFAYWLQLTIALGLATLGLVLNGPAVVIGAMLVSPLMSPILELGMGLAVGSPLLSIRSLVRTFASIVVVVVGASLLTAALPFHEVTGEVAARTSPTALDLLVAVFCALAAVFTTLRSGSSAVATAAGTAIAIALVPPLCVVGFGVGTADGRIAQGAFLLFTANLCAILLVAVVSFWILGFNLVDAHRLEQTRFEGPEPLTHPVRFAKTLFGSRFGTWVRLIVPLALVAMVWVPLRRALRQVSWEVRTRAEVQKVIGEMPLARNAVRSSITLTHEGVHLTMVVVGKPSQGRALQGALATRIAAATGAHPIVEVLAVPDLETMEDVARTLAKRELAERAPPPDFAAAGAQVGDALKQSWPSTAGQLRRWHVDLGDRGHPTIQVVHLGAPLGAPGQTLLASLLSERLHTPLTVQEIAIQPDPITADASEGSAWLTELTTALDWLHADDGLSACVTLPPPDEARPRRRARPKRDEAVVRLRSAALAELAKAPADRVHWQPGPIWSVQVQTTPCEGTPSSP
jgi:uncharacterized hydrophobic protein (TIGR00271 family)